MESRASSFSKI